MATGKELIEQADRSPKESIAEESWHEILTAAFELISRLESEAMEAESYSREVAYILRLKAEEIQSLFGIPKGKPNKD